MRLEPSDLVAFAAASHDHNPLHLDDGFTHGTPYGRPIVPGALLLATALGRLPDERLGRLTGVRASFHRAVFPGTEFHLADRDTRLTIMCEGSRAVTIDLSSDSPGGTGQRLAGEHRTDHYQPDLPALRTLLRRLGADHLPDRLLAWLAWSSWVVGMRPHGALARLTLATSPGAGPESQIQVTDERPGAITAIGTYAGAEATFQAVTHVPSPRVTTASMSRYLAPSDALAGKQILVVGGSRGLGACLAGALASQAATVWVLYRRSTDHAEQLAGEFGQARIRPIQCDATNLAQLDQALRPIRQAGGLSGLALIATPPLRALGMHPDAVPAQLDFIHTSLAVAVNPLAVAGKLLADSGGWLVLASSGAIRSPHPGWTHYAAAKSAVETYATDFAKKRAVPTLIMRAPKMNTSLADGSAGRQDASPPEQVAATVVKWLHTNASVRPNKVDVIHSADQLVPSQTSNA
ncbi:MAG: SDR family NAD(P)-dependent oxidoreductase [Kibdelosporangium sp.]